MGVVVIEGRTAEHFMYGVFAYMLTAMFVYLGLRLRFVYALALGWGSLVASIAFILRNGSADALTLALIFTFALAANVLGMFGCYLVDKLSRQSFAAMLALERERERVDRLLENILPRPIAARLKERPTAIADGHDDVTVLFADIVDFTPLSTRLPPDELVRLLNDTFSAFDDIAARHGVEKIKTIGDAYMAAAGLPKPAADHAAAIARVALEMRRHVELHGHHRLGRLQLRIGIHCGPVVAGVIGTKKFIYDLWG
ncbi:MAG: adenylate/guanylate cyclase domain-containing protein, partial [Myxococcales bacterium]|nr:adenylate/guanylate cyclase domain-containing protein [Myxococcales bacterium]